MQVQGKPRVIVLTSTYPRWAGDREPPFVHLLSQRLVENYDIQVLAPHHRGGKTVEKMDGVRVSRFKYFFPRWQSLAYEGGILSNIKKNPWLLFQVPFFCFFELIAVIQLIKSQKFDLIHAHWMIPQGLIAVLARKLVRSKTKILLTSHGADLFALNGRFAGFLKKWVLKDVEAISVVSHAMSDHLEAMGVDKTKVTVAPMGADFEKFHLSASTKKIDGRLVFAGRLVEKKGVEYLLKALSDIKKIRPQAHLLIYGDGPLKLELEELTRQLGIVDSVEFLGAVPQQQIVQAYQAAQVAVMPSVIAEGGDQEGLGLSIIEGIACGCIPVLSDLPATRDILPSRYEMLYAKPADVENLIEKILLAFEVADKDPGVILDIRQQTYEKFSWGSCLKRYSRLYQEQISSANTK